MNKARLEAFSDGVLAVIITIMVLELKVPHGAGLADLAELGPVFSSYLLSFIYVAIYWNNHHHMLHTVKYVDGGLLWANMHLLFWLSLVPFTTAWMAENSFALWPTVIYGGVLLACGSAYTLLQAAVIRKQGPQSLLARAVGRDAKGRLSLLLYLTAIGLAFVHPAFAEAIYALVALMWLVPDRRIERMLAD